MTIPTVAGSSRIRAYRDAWTVSFGPPAHGPETVVVVPFNGSLPDGFARCHELGDRDGSTVRLVGLGATMSRHRPAWVERSARPLLLSELDGYVPREKGAALAALEPGIRRWLDQVLADVVPGIAPSQIFFAPLMERTLLDATECWLMAAGLSALHATDLVVTTEPGSALARMLTARRSPSQVTPARRIGWRDFGATLVYAVAGAVRRVGSFIAEAPSRRRLRTLRKTNAATPPRVWIGAVGHWPRMSLPAIEVVPPLARAAGESIGVLLQATLRVGLQRGVAGERDRRAVLPTLDAPELVGAVAAVEQGVSVESWRSLASVLLRGGWLAMRAIARARRLPLVLEDGQARCVFTPEIGPLTRLLSVDVLRACEAYEAARALTRRQNLSGAVLVWPHCNGVADATTDRVLAGAGVSTIELMHGLSEVGYALRTGHTPTGTKLLWSIPEAEDMAPFRPEQRCLGGFLPRSSPAPVERRSLGPDDPIPALIVSSYLVSAYGHDPRLYEPYLVPLLEAALEAQRTCGRVVLRWRPHPGDDAARIAKLRRAYPMLEPSSGTLDEDLRWCRVLVTCMSSVAFEALRYDVPIFVHDIPRWDDTALRVFDRRRLFGCELALSELLAPCVAELRAGSAQTLAPERALERTLFGPTGRPRSLGPLLFGEIDSIERPRRLARPL